MQSGKTLINNSNGSVSTMKSVTFSADGKVYLAPSIRNINGKIVEFNQAEAVAYAKKNHDAIQFNSQEEADAYDKKLHEEEYKRLGIKQKYQ